MVLFKIAMNRCIVALRFPSLFASVQGSKMNENAVPYAERFASEFSKMTNSFSVGTNDFQFCINIWFDCNDFTEIGPF
jgi:hypothetical protein